ncbi:MAG: MliC family protein [Desulfobacterales bacterium]
MKSVFNKASVSTVLAAACWWLWAPVTMAQSPSFDCTEATSGSIEEMICKNSDLAALDRNLADVYAAASQKAVNERPPLLKAEQRGWIKGRNDCWKSEAPRQCVESSYRYRIAELQARYRLVDGNGPITYSCDGDSRNEVVAFFFETDPPTLIAERGDQVSLMFMEKSASGSRYQGRNESLWEHGREAAIVWGFGSKAMRCKRTP